MTRTWLVLAAIAGTAALAPSAHAEGYLILNGGVLFPVGDADWKDLVEPSASFAVRGGSSRRIARGARVGFEAGLEYAPLSTELDGALVQVDFNRYRVIFGARYEQLVARGLLLSLRGGLGISHLRVEASALGQSESDSDTGVALDLAAGLWFAAGSTLLGLELGLPSGFHSDDNSDNNDAAVDFRTTELALSAGVRFQL